MYFDVATPQLRASGGRLNRTAEGVGAASAELAASTDAASAHPGWQSSASLSRCVAAWTARLKTLSRDLGQSADDLRRNADDYDDADGQTKFRLAAIGTDAAQLGS